MSTAVPHVSVFLKDTQIGQGVEKIIQVARPSWCNQEECNGIKLKVFSDGLSNTLVGFFHESNKDDIIIVKVYGVNTDNLIDRKAEIENMIVLYERGVGAQLFATFNNGICYEYINGYVPTIEDCRKVNVFTLIAAEMARLHSLKIVNPETVLTTNPFWDKVENLHSMAEETMREYQHIRERLAALGVKRGWATAAIQNLKMQLAKEKMPVTFCHNDISLNNVVINEKKGRATFIDVEYALFNFPAYDIAHHFMEFVGVENLDFSKCPNKKWRLDWITEYLKHLQLTDYTAHEITPELFNHWVEMCIPLTHIFWCLWSTVQSAHSTIDFDYMDYVGQRYAEFKKNRYWSCH